MRKFIFTAVALMLSFVGGHAQEIKDIRDFFPKASAASSVNILAIGDSYTEDAVAYLPQMLREAGIATVKIATLTQKNTSLQQLVESAKSKEKGFILATSVEGGGFHYYPRQVSLVEGLTSGDKWDYVVLQQQLELSDNYATYQPYLNELLSIVLQYHPESEIAWHLAWVYGKNASEGAFSDNTNGQTTRYNAILDAAHKVQAATGIMTIVPTGKVIQALREAKTDTTDNDMLRDSKHLDLGAGRYAAACTWFETLVAPLEDVTIVGNLFRMPFGNVPVTDANATEIQEIVRKIVKEQ